MFKKCKANCQANDNLYLRGDVFYYMVELPRQDGKRRYFIKSLHTKNYYEALEKAKNMKKALFCIIYNHGVFVIGHEFIV